MTIPAQAIQAAAKALAYIEPGEDWPSNTDLGGHAILGTRDDEYNWAMEQDAERALTAALPHIEAALRTQIAAEISDAAMTLTSGSIAEVARSVQRQATRIAEEGTTK